MNRKMTVSLVATAITLIGVIAYQPLSNIWAESRVRPAAVATPAQRGDAVAAREKDQGQATLRALRALRSAAARAPRDAGAWGKLGDAEMRLGHSPQAIEAYRRSLAIDGGQASIWSSLGEVYVESTPIDGPHMPPAAKQAFDKAIAADPNDLRARFYLAGEKDTTGMHDAAMEDWIAILASVPRGSQPDRAVRAAIGASMRRNLTSLKDRLNAAMKAQPAA